MKSALQMYEKTCTNNPSFVGFFSTNIDAFGVVTGILQTSIFLDQVVIN